MNDNKMIICKQVKHEMRPRFLATLLKFHSIPHASPQNPPPATINISSIKEEADTSSLLL